MAGKGRCNLPRHIANPDVKPTPLNLWMAFLISWVSMLLLLQKTWKCEIHARKRHAAVDHHQGASRRGTIGGPLRLGTERCGKHGEKCHKNGEKLIHQPPLFRESESITVSPGTPNNYFKMDGCLLQQPFPTVDG